MRALAIALTCLLIGSCTSLDTYYSAMGTREDVYDTEESWKMHVAPEVDYLRLDVHCQADAGRFAWSLVGPDGTTITDGFCDSECELTQEWDSPAEGVWVLSWKLEEFVGFHHLELTSTG